MSYLEERRHQKQFGKIPKEKPVKYLNKKSAQKIAEEKAEKALADPDEDSAMEIWHKARRKERSGTCQCGCGQRSFSYDKKNDDKYFRHNNCHVFPKRIFESVKLHPKNCVERAFFGGCHNNMDERSMDLWPKFSDWEDIKEKFHLLAPLLTDQERATKFYTQLESLIYKN